MVFALNESTIELFRLVASEAFPSLKKMGSIAGRLSQGTEKSGWFFYSCEVLFSSGLPSRGVELHSIPHHIVEQIVVEDDTFTRAGVFDVKDQIRNAVVR